MSITEVTVKPGQRPTAEQAARIEEAAKRPIVLDEESPEYSEEEYREMFLAAQAKRAERVKPTISLRISPETLAIAKSTGKGYTGFLSRLLDNAIRDPEMVRKSL